MSIASTESCSKVIITIGHREEAEAEGILYNNISEEYTYSYIGSALSQTLLFNMSQ